jgi:hypothetical protein
MSPNRAPIIAKNLLKLIEITGILDRLLALIELTCRNILKHLAIRLANQKRFRKAGHFLIVKRVSAETLKTRE